jgi:hypothetical protein
MNKPTQFWIPPSFLRSKLPRKACLLPLVLAFLAVSCNGAEVPSSPFLGVVYRYADAMLQHGRDTFGPQKSNLFLSALDRGALSPLTHRPPAPAGVREGDRVGVAPRPLVGANPQHDENLLRLLYVLTALSGKRDYSDAADAELKWFLENTRSPETALLPWGEHMSWNVLTDEPIPGRASGESAAVHEFARPWMLWERCFESSPEASHQFALGLWEHQIADHKTGAFDRHAAFYGHGPRDGMDFPRHAGFYIRTWAVDYSHTKDPTILSAIETLLGRFENKRHPETGLIEHRTGDPLAIPASSLSLAIDCDAAARYVPQPLSSRLRAFASREDEVFCGLPHDLKGKSGFVTSVEKATGKPVGDCTPLWEARYGGYTTAQVAMMCVARYENTGKIGYRDLIVWAADAYLKSTPPDDQDVWPMTFGHAISLQLAAWRHTARVEYLDFARELGSLAVEKFWQENPLPRASSKTQHYESITGADSLALALVELHLSILHITAVNCPSNTIDR